MCKVLFEDENPQLTAEILVHFESEDEPRWVPVGIGDPEFRTALGEELPWNGDRTDTYEVVWHCEPWEPDQPTQVLAVKVVFIGYDDLAINKMEQYLNQTEDGMDVLHARYSISYDNQSEVIV